ncbi:hypothetical protein GGR56DRAFT_373803 [Xylariaceae sp. FL0804]|nr:hypothetical protein GGR56DRAFT_373803 [Xylariaceae sp. FL0804]
MRMRHGEEDSFEFLRYQPADSPAEEISVRQDAFWSYCGPLLASEADELPSSLDDWADAALAGPLRPALLPFLTFANQVLTEAGLGHYWLTIRATRPTAEFDRPRWHTDDMFFGGDGADTLAPAVAAASGPDGAVAAAAAARGECARFRVGRSRGAVHSEPSMSDKGGDGRGRVFVNVVPGRRDELARLAGAWGMEFPRSWWVAPRMCR